MVSVSLDIFPDGAHDNSSETFTLSRLLRHACNGMTRGLPLNLSTWSSTSTTPLRPLKIEFDIKNGVCPGTTSTLSQPFSLRGRRMANLLVNLDVPKLENNPRGTGPVCHPTQVFWE